MKNRLKTIVDLERYPIQDLSSPKIKETIKKCKSDLNKFSCATIPNFILYKSLKIMKTELEKQIKEVYMSSRESQAMKSLEVALDHALARLNELEGKDRLAFAREYKEWLADDELKEKVWFSIPLKKAPDSNVE